MHALSKIALRVAGGVLHCARSGCKLLRLLREVEPGFYFVQRSAQQNSHALQVAEVPCYTVQFFNNAMVFRCKLLEIARCDRTWTTFGEIMAIVLLSRKRCRAIAPQQQ